MPPAPCFPSNHQLEPDPIILRHSRHSPGHETSPNLQKPPPFTQTLTRPPTRPLRFSHRKLLRGAASLAKGSASASSWFSASGAPDSFLGVGVGAWRGGSRVFVAARGASGRVLGRTLADFSRGSRYSARRVSMTPRERGNPSWRFKRQGIPRSSRH